MFSTINFNEFSEKLNKSYSIEIKDIERFFHIGILDLFFIFPERSAYNTFFQEQSSLFVIPNDITICSNYKQSLLYNFGTFVCNNNLSLTNYSYCLLAKSDLFSLNFSTLTSYDSDYGDVNFLINFNLNDFSDHELSLLNSTELNSFKSFINKNLYSSTFRSYHVEDLNFICFNKPFKLNIFQKNDYLVQNLVQEHINSMLEEYEIFKKFIKNGTEHFFERGLLEKQIKSF